MRDVPSLRGRLIGGTTWAVLGAGIVQGLGLLSAILIARFLGKEGFGQYGIVMSTVGMFGVFAGLAMGYTATKHVAEFRVIAPERAGRFIGMTLLLGVVSSGLLASCLAVFSPVFGREVLGNTDIIGVLRLSVPILVLNTVFDIEMASLAGLEAFKSIAKSNVGVGLTNLGCAVVGVWLYGLQGAIVGYVVARAVGCLILRETLRRRCKEEGIVVSYRAQRRDWLCAWSFSFPSFISNIIANPAQWILNVLLVRNPGGMAQMGLVQAATQWRSAVSFFPMRLMSVGLPVLSNLFGQRDYRRYYKVVKATQLTVLGIALGTALPIALLGRRIMEAYGEGFAEGYMVLVLLMCAGVLMVLELSLSEVLLSRGRAWSKLLAYATSSVLSVTLFWQVFRERQAVGLAMSLCLGNMVGVLLLTAQLLRLWIADRRRKVQ